MKECSKCHSILEDNSFSKRVSAKDGLHPWCKVCTKQYRSDNKDHISIVSKQYFSENRDIILKKSKEYHTRNRETELERGRAYYQENKNKVKESLKRRAVKVSDAQKRYYLANKEQLNEKQREYHKNNKLKAKNRNLQNNFGLTLDEYNNKLLSQNNVCAICGDFDKDRALAVDHNHNTGQIRGLLCKSCNLILGRIKEDVNTLINMIAYLKLYNGE